MYVLAIDDDPDTLKLLAFVLHDAGYQFTSASDWASCIGAIEQVRPGLVLLEAQLRSGSGFELCRRLRGLSDVPLIFLAQRAEVEERVPGLSLGADDYVAKPFEAAELLARIAAVLRRSGHIPAASAGRFGYGGFLLDQFGQRVLLGTRAIELTPTEFRLLEYLVINAGHVLSPRQILDQVWDRGDSNDFSVISTYILRLRNKIEADPAAPRHIITVWNMGYKFEAAPPRAALREIEVGG